MYFRKIMFLSVFFISILSVSSVVSAQEAPVVNPVAAPVSEPVAAAPAQEKNDMQWAWGEVTNVDTQANAFTIKYLDYETDQEKELVLAVDDKTTFEGIKGLDEIKLKDTLSIDYAVGPDNKNIARNISFEKPEAAVSEPAEKANLTEASVPPVVSPAPEPVQSAAAPASESVQNAAPASEPATAAGPATEPVQNAAPAPEPAQTSSNTQAQ